MLSLNRKIRYQLYRFFSKAGHIFSSLVTYVVLQILQAISRILRLKRHILYVYDSLELSLISSRVA